ncbi:MAG TPA: YidC/Oxa1 family insertase periplasmic-domain containing protein, partial [Bacteroidia bacterium]
MDRNSITGIIVICALMFAWMWYSAPTKQEIAKKRAKDSLELVEKKKAEQAAGKTSNSSGNEAKNTSTAATAPTTDSAKKVEAANKYDVFAPAAKDSNQFFTVENELIKATISKKGGRICSVLLKKYFRHGGTPLVLFDADSSSFGIKFDTEHNRTISTNDLYFQPVGTSFEVKGEESKKIAMRLYASADSSGKSNRYLEYEYSLAGNSYMLGCKLNVVGMNNVIASNISELDL